MPLKLTEEVRGILTSGKPAHLVTLNPDGSQSHLAGLDGYLAITGTARISQGGAPQLLRRLAAVYLGPGPELPWTYEPPPGHVTYITAERIVRPDPPNRYKPAPARLPSGRTIALPSQKEEFS